MRWWVRRKNVLLVICVLVLCVLLQLKDALTLHSLIDERWPSHVESSCKHISLPSDFSRVANSFIWPFFW
jgi:hypothetical protein